MKTMRAGRGSASGFTLLEVLTAIFVLTFGLLGITAMMQIGGYRVWQATRRDKASSIAEQAHNDLIVRETVPTLQRFQRFLGQEAFLNRSMTVYDPTGTWHEAKLVADGITDPTGAGRFGSRLGMARVSSYFGGIVGGVWSDQPPVSGNRFFDPVWTQATTSRDDLVWNTDNRERRPVAEYWTGTSMIPAIDASGSFDPAALTPAYNGNWSWMATIQPLGGRQSNLATSEWMYQTGMYEISVAVYESRSFGNEVGFVVGDGVDIGGNPVSVLEGMLKKTLTVRPSPGGEYAGITPSRAILQPGQWVALIGPPVEAVNAAGVRGKSMGPADNAVVWMKVISASPASYDPSWTEVQLVGADLVDPVTREPVRISSRSDETVYLVTDPDIVGVVTRTVTVAE